MESIGISLTGNYLRVRLTDNIDSYLALGSRLRKTYILKTCTIRAGTEADIIVSCMSVFLSPLLLDICDLIPVIITPYAVTDSHGCSELVIGVNISAKVDACAILITISI